MSTSVNTPPRPALVTELPSSTGGNAGPTKEDAAIRKSKPTKVLPTERVNFEKQLKILRAYVAASGDGTKPSSLGEAAALVDMNANTVSIAVQFFANTGLLQRTDGGSYLPSADALSFHRAYEWDAETAAHKLAPTLREQWFFHALSARLSLNPMEEEQAITVLAEASAASPEYKTNLRFLLDYLVASGLVLRDGSTLRLPKSGQPEAPPREPVKPLIQKGEEKQSGNSASGRIQINVSVDVDMAELSSWQPDRLSAFFSGIAQVLAAKKGS